MNETTFTVNWTEPAEVNGVLQTYTISTREEGSSSVTEYYNTLATSFSIHELGKQIVKCLIIVHYLTPLTRTATYTPYIVSVAAINGAGIGNFVSIVEFTAEGGKIFPQQFKSYNFVHTVPISHPRDIGSTRLNGTGVRVSWRPLTRSEARGFITNYTITYWRVGSNAANASTITVSGEDASSATIVDLNPNSDYYFTVSAGTVQGVGNVSAAMVIPAQSSDNQCRCN